MKLHLPLSLLAALVACSAALSYAETTTFIAEGVSLDKTATDSTRFFDSGKGAYWTSFDYSNGVYNYHQPMAGASELLSSTHSYEYLGDLYKFVPEDCQGEQTGFQQAAFSNLRDDDAMCWAHTASNVIQYWQSYYGVFSSKASALPHGYTYDARYVAKLAGTQSLKVGEEFRRAWSNGGGDFTIAADWWMKGTLDNVWTGTASLDVPNTGAYFSDFYASADAYTQAFAAAASQSQFNSYLLDGLGYSKSNGTYTQAVQGQLVALGIYSSAGGHALTCYGVDLDAEGNVIALHLTNSDDEEYKLFTVKVEKRGDNYYLCNQDGSSWSYLNATDWYIELVTSINTTDELIAMRADYDSNELVWNGKSTTWADGAGKEAIALPTKESGWTVEVGKGNARVAQAHKGTYASYYANGRDAVFNDSAFTDNPSYDGSVKLDGDVAVGKWSIDNSAYDYSFSGAHTITADCLVKTGSAAASFTDTALVFSGDTDVTGGTMSLEGSASLDTVALTVDGAAVKLASTAKLSTDNVTVTGGGSLSTVGRGFVAASVSVKDVSGTMAYTIQGTMRRTLGANLVFKSIEGGGSLSGTLNNETVQVAAGSILELDSAVLGFSPIVAEANAILSVAKSSIYVDISAGTGVVDGLKSGAVLTGCALEAPLILGQDVDVFTVNSDMLRNMSVSGSELTLDLYDRTDPYGEITGLDQYHFLAITFDSTSFYGMDSLQIAGKGSYSHQYAAYYIEPLDEDAGVKTIYFALRDDIPTQSIPEPATATLGLLALAGLMARRRRR